MDFFAIQVWTGKENEYAKLCGQSGLSLEIIIPKKVLNIRRKAVVKKEEKPIFPGYVFIASDRPELELGQRTIIKQTKNFLRILPKTSNPSPIRDADRKLLSHIISFGKLADISKVYFDTNDRIVVMEGPMKGLEGCIVKVDKRKRRAKLRLDMCENMFLVDLGFDLIDKAEKGPSN